MAPAAPAPVVADPAQKFGDNAANDFLDKFKAYADKTAEAIQSGDTKKYHVLMAEGNQLVRSAQNYAARLSQEELPAFKARVDMYSQTVADLVKHQLPTALEKFKAKAAERIEAAKAKAAAALVPTPPPAEAVPATAPVAPETPATPNTNPQ